MSAIWRSLARGGILSVANAAGLAAAFAAVILLAGLVRYELSFNHAVEPGGEVYQVYTRFARAGQSPVVSSGTVTDLAAALRAQLAGVIVARFAPQPEPQRITIGDRKFYE